MLILGGLTEPVFQQAGLDLLHAQKRVPKLGDEPTSELGAALGELPAAPQQPTALHTIQCKGTSLLDRLAELGHVLELGGVATGEPLEPVEVTVRVLACFLEGRDKRTVPAQQVSTERGVGLLKLGLQVSEDRPDLPGVDDHPLIGAKPLQSALGEKGVDE